MSNEGKAIKITDRRIFTPDGQLREEYRFLDEKSTAEEPAGGAPDAAGSAPPAAAVEGAGGPPAGASAGSGAGAHGSDRSDRSDRPDRPDGPGGYSQGPAGAQWSQPQPQHGAGDYSSARLELPMTPPGMGPSFFDLAAMLAEPVPIYLGDVDLPDGQPAENLEMARLYIDLLDVLRQKTAGNLTAQESAFLEDLLYRLRVRYVQKSR